MSRSSPVTASQHMASHREHDRKQRDELARHDEDLLIEGCEGESLPKFNATNVLGCYAKKKHICRDVLEAPMASRLDTVTRTFFCIC